MKSFECERVQLLQEETSENLRKSEKERQIIREKLECLGNQSETTVKDLQLLVKELSMKLKDSNRQLLAYEKLEQELDDVVMQAAEG
jgi:progesterone-induced-blocking factor 1